MLNFFKDMLKETYYNIAGLDVEKIKIEESKKNKNNFVNGWLKIIIWFMGLVYFLTGGYGIYIAIHNKVYFSFVKYTLLIGLDVAILVLISLKNKKCQRIGIVLIVFFIIFNMIINQL